MQNHDQGDVSVLKTIQHTFDDIAAEFDVTRNKPWPQTVEFVAGLPEGGVILDLGCGNGQNTKYLASVESGFRIIGLDFSVRMLRIAREKHRQGGLHANVDFVLGDVASLPLRAQSLDGALYVAALHHLPSSALRLASLLELERCLKPGGKAFISVWDFEQERFRAELEKQLAEPPVGEFGDVYVPWQGKRGKTHQRFYHLFYKSELEELLGETDLVVENLFRAADNYHVIARKR